MEPGSTQLVLDLSQLRNVTLNDEALMREVLGALVSDTSDQIEELHRAVKRADGPACIRLAHSAHGACGNVGAVSLAMRFSAFESHARQGEFAVCESFIQDLSVELEKLRLEASSI